MFNLANEPAPPADRFSQDRLESAARRGDIGAIRAELELPGAPERHPAKRSRELDDALVEAACSGTVEACAYLIDRGADPRSFASRAMRSSAARGRVEIVAFLLERGAEASAQENEALRDAAALGRARLAEVLLDGGAEPRCAVSLGNAVRLSGSAEIVRMLLERGASVYEDDEQELLADAVERDQREIAALLLDHGADPRAADHRALRAAALARRHDLVALLLARGADQRALG